MDTRSLRDHLTQLRAELVASGSIDPETRVLLDDIARDIERLSESPGASPAARLEGIAVRFEADHPAIAANIRRLVDLLGKAGV
jgi:hypothetical protein